MNNNDVFLKNNKANYVKNLSANNEAKRLEAKVKAYNKNLNNDRNSNLNKPASNTSPSEQKISIPRRKPNTTNSKATNQLASKGAQALGVPKPLADKAVNSDLGQKIISRAKKKNFALNALDKLMGGGQKQVEEQASDGGGSSFKITYNVIKYISIALLGSLVPFMILAMIIPSSMIYLNSIKLGQADSISSEDAEKKINKKSKDDETVDEEDIGKVLNSNDDADTLYAYVDIYSSNSSKFKSLKLDSSNTTKYLKRKYNEATLDALEEFYPSIGQYGKDSNKNLVYDFFFKMYNLYTTYRDDYGVYLDLPLLMATLNKQSDDMAVVFSSNLTEADRAKTARKKPIEEFSYDYNWAAVGYKLTKNKSEHDMEILAQHMVSKQSLESCQDSSGNKTQEKILKDSEIGKQTLQCAEGESYQTEDLGFKVDYDKYNEFLRQFLERKYFIKGGYTLEGYDTIDSPSTPDDSVPNSNSFAEAMINVANNEFNQRTQNRGGLKYINAYGGFVPNTPWCAIFVWYVSANTTYNGQHLYPDIIPFKSAGTGTYIKYFNSSKNANIKFYYNDNCKNLKGKNGKGTTYTPKAGDYIFFDWDAKYYDISSNTQDHTGMVEKYENGYIYTIEGNTGSNSNTKSLISKGKYSINDCRVIGFGSWY